MTETIYGWRGRILHVDLTDGKITELNTMDYADRFLGGRGVATRLYWEMVPPHAGAFDPDNHLIVMTGPLGATGVQGASRFEVAAKSPMLLPERFCYGNLGGFFGPYLKKAGYDGIVVAGRAGRPCYIHIHDDGAVILDAAPLWGRGTREVRAILRETHGPGVRFLTTGPAGENLVRTATLMTDHEGSATGGFGAVLGSKNLKAISVVGTGRPAVAHPDTLTELNRYTMKLSRRGTLRMPVPKSHINYTGKASCFQCGLDCIRGTFRTVSGREAVRKCQSLVVYMPWALKRPGEPGEQADTVLDATDMCNDLSICTMEMNNVLMWLEACRRDGILTDEDIGLDMSQAGSREFFEKLISMIARRKGFGNLLAEGLLRAGEALGRDAKERFSEMVGGVGLSSAYSPREYKTTALLYAMEPRQPIAMLHSVSYNVARWLLHLIRPDLSPTSSECFRNVAKKFWGHEKAWDLSTYEGKAVAAANIQNRYYAMDSLVLCDAAWPMTDSFDTPDNVGDPDLEARLFSAVTGIETDTSGLFRYGERIFNQQRAVLLREGWRAPEDDYPPEFNFTTPIQSDMLNPQLIVPGPADNPISVRGAVLDRDRYEDMRTEFYVLRGWDPETGLQKAGTLKELEMSDVAEELAALGLTAG
jgi:aldehyde:ferredoxin oxidoreductase